MVFNRNRTVPPSRLRAGLTLTELLVVIAILVVVTSVLAPLITPSLEGREVRESARQINAYFQQAQAKAKQLGRPVGVVIQRSPTVAPGQDYAYQLSLAEQPPPFKGMTAADTATVAVNNDGTFRKGNLNGQPAAIARIVMPGMGSPLGFLRSVQPNDQIRFNYRGPKYRIAQVKATNEAYPKPSFLVYFRVDSADTTTFMEGNSLKFEVFRRPRLSSSTPLELAVGTALIMDLSGVGLDSESIGMNLTGSESPVETLGTRQKYMGLTEFQRLNADKTVEGFPSSTPDDVYAELTKLPLTIMFTPDGKIDRVYRVLPPFGMLAPSGIALLPPKRPQDKIYLFVGKDGMDWATNFADTSNVWIAIDPQNGLVTTAPHVPDPTIDHTESFKRRLMAIAAARQIAATGQSMGGQ